jgi:peptidyl-tRNA hydrolase
MAAVWIKELAQSLSKFKKTAELVHNWDREGCGSKVVQKVKKYKTLKLKSKRKLKMQLTASHIHKQMVKEVEKWNPHLKKVMPLKIQKLPNRLTKLQLIWETILKPNTWTKIFLPWYVACYSIFISADCIKTWCRGDMLSC